MLHKTYLPFTEEDLKEHFRYSENDITENLKKRIAKFEKSIKNYSEYIPDDTDKKKWKIIRQIEKDETFWTASSLMTIFRSDNSKEELKNVLIHAFGEKPPLDDFSNWEDCLKDELFLFFEPQISSPKKYRDWLKENVENRTIIPYILEKAKHKNGNEYRSNLESSTKVDALLLNKTNGFNVFIEAKVLSDISHSVDYDSTRNQIARNLDVMLSKDESNNFFNKRKTENSLFLLLTPEVFKDNSRSRLYGYVIDDYQKNSESIKRDLPHRDDIDFENIPKRIGWITWEKLKEINSDCCKWINKF